MKFLILIVVLAAILAVLFIAWRQQRVQERRMVTLVALLKEPQLLDAAIVARAAKEAWGAELGDGSDESEAPDGFVMESDEMPSLVVRYHERLILVNHFDQPYVDDPGQVALQAADLRLQKVFADHRAWISCDALGVDENTPPEEIEEWYRLIASLLAELVDDNTLAIYVTDTSLMYPYNARTIECLQSNSPLAALQQELESPVPVVRIEEDDPRMAAAVAQAKESWPEFVAAFESRRGESFSVKAPITRDENTEFIWLEVTAIENEMIYGRLANQPVNLGELTLGSQVSVPLDKLNDWIYIDQNEEMRGGYTVKVVSSAASEQTDE